LVGCERFQRIVDPASFADALGEYFLRKQKREKEREKDLASFFIEYPRKRRPRLRLPACSASTHLRLHARRRADDLQTAFSSGAESCDHQLRIARCSRLGDVSRDQLTASNSASNRAGAIKLSFLPFGKPPISPRQTDIHPINGGIPEKLMDYETRAPKRPFSLSLSLLRTRARARSLCLSHRELAQATISARSKFPTLIPAATFEFHVLFY